MAKDVHAALVDVLAGGAEDGAGADAAAGAAAAPAPPAAVGGPALLAQMRARQAAAARPPPAPSAEERAAAARAAAESELAEMKASGRYQLDLWALDHGFDDDLAAAEGRPAVRVGVYTRARGGGGGCRCAGCRSEQTRPRA